LGEVLIRLHSNGNTFNGRGVSTDIIEASAKAYLQAINRQVVDEPKNTVNELVEI